MAFNAAVNRVPTSIGAIYRVLDDKDGTNPNRSIDYFLEVLDQLDIPMDLRSGDEQPHLTAQQITGFLSFMATRQLALPTDLGFSVGNVCGRIVWRFADLDGTSGGRSLRARVTEQTALGAFVQNHTIDEQPNLSAGQVTAIVTFLDTQRALAESEILP